MSTTDKWTPEPWAFDSGKIRGAMMTAKPYNIASINGHATSEGLANGERAVACVNACAGMADPANELADMRCQLEAFPAVVEALREIINLPDGGRGYGDHAVDIARAALAAVEGK